MRGRTLPPGCCHVIILLMPPRTLLPGDVLVFAAQPPLPHHLVVALASFAPTVMETWPALELNAARARCIVLCDQAPDTSGVPGRARHLTQRLTTAPIVVVTTRAAEHVRAFVSSGITEICWTHDSPSVLQHAVEATVRKQPLDALAAQFQRATGLPLYLRNTLIYLCRAQTSVRTVGELCAAAGCHRSTLWSQWRATGADTVLRLQDVVDWVILLRACSQRAPGIGWGAVAAEAGVHEHTIARIARRLMGCGLRELRHPLSATMVHAELSAALAPLLEPHSANEAASIVSARSLAG